MDSHEAARVLAIAAGYQKGKIAALGVLAQLLENIAVGKFPIEQFVREFDARFPSMEETRRREDNVQITGWCPPISV